MSHLIWYNTLDRYCSRGLSKVQNVEIHRHQITKPIARLPWLGSSCCWILRTWLGYTWGTREASICNHYQNIDIIVRTERDELILFYNTMFRIHRKLETLWWIILFVLICLYVSLRESLIQREEPNIGFVEETNIFIDDGREDQDHFVYVYTGHYRNATVGKELRISSSLRRHFGWHKMEFARISLGMTSSFVVVSAASSSLEGHLESIIGSVQLYLPNTTIIVYDLGMTEPYVMRVSSALKQTKTDYRQILSHDPASAHMT